MVVDMEVAVDAAAVVDEVENKVGDVVDEVSPRMEAWLQRLPEGLLAGCFLDYGADAEVSGDTLQARKPLFLLRNYL